VVVQDAMASAVQLVHQELRANRVTKDYWDCRARRETVVK
jgi:hypothetical protein